MIPSFCNVTPFVGVLDYAYLATNVYHDPSENKLLGFRPTIVKKPGDLKTIMNSANNKGWLQLDFPAVNLNLASPFYADLYVKVYQHKIQHIMVAFRGTVPSIPDNLKEDAVTWCVDFLQENNNDLDPLPSYWYQVCGFILSVADVLRELDAMQLLAPEVGYHVTGHSLGGALANLVSAKAIVLTSPHMQSRVSPVADVISFNAPGVGSMPIAASTFHEHRVITMRAKYDTVSRIGKPYGYIIDNIVPESYEACKHAFEFEHVAQMVKTPLPGDMSSEIATSAARDLLHVTAGVEDKHLIDQHSMANLLKVICAQSCCASLNFLRLRHWADTHGGLNHDFKAEPLWGHAPLAKAA